jgi:hypothetical protein
MMLKSVGTKLSYEFCSNHNFKTSILKLLFKRKMIMYWDHQVDNYFDNYFIWEYRDET